MAVSTNRLRRTSGANDPDARVKAIERRFRRALRNLQSDAALPVKEKLGVLRGLEYEIGLLAAALEPPSREGSSGPYTRFEETRI